MKKNRKNNRNEDMMFLGIDGFEEIESLFPKAPKKAEAPHRHTRQRKKSLAAVTTKMKTSKALRAAKVIPAPAHLEGGAQPKRVYKKRAVLAVAAGVTAVMFSFATVANAMCNAQPAPAQVSTSPAQPAAALPDIESSPISIAGFEEATTPDMTVKEEIRYALYIDDEFAGVVKDSNALRSALNQILLDAKEGFDDTTTTEFINKIELLPYEGDAEPAAVEDVIEEAQYMLSVLLETDWMYEEEIPYDTEIIYDDSQPEGYEEILREGQNGVTQYKLRLSYIDGEQTDYTVTSEEVLSEPVAEQILVGTGAPAAEESVSASGFIWPLPHTHNITSLMGERWGRMHNGIDIAGGDDYGQPFVAADGGTVVWAGNDGGGYGNYVMIDHGNGYMTVYGHASELACSTGDYVSQGDVIGYVGSTGNSTGPHLHFEIRLDGDYQDPLNYVS